MAATMNATQRASTTRPQKVSAGAISSLRIRPFTRATRSVLGAPRQQQQLVVARAAEPEAVVEEAFEFSFTDAKKGNEYSASDVEAALRFYEGEGEAPGDVNNEFVENLFGIEDAAFFDDMDNNEAYDDEFIAAGIPEAAPKQRQGRQRGGDDDAEGIDSDEIAAAKEADKLKQIEEQMVLDAELQETGLDQEVESTYKTVGPAVWDWMSDMVDDDEDELAAYASASNKSIAANLMAALPTDEEVFADLRGANLQEIDPETRETIEFLLDDFDLETEVKAVPDNVDEVLALPEFTPLADSDVARVEALLAEDLTPPELDLSGLESIAEIVDDGLDMSEEAVANYISTLQTAQGVELSEDQVRAAQLTLTAV